MQRLRNNPNLVQLFPSSSSGLLAWPTSSPLPPASRPACFSLVPMLSTPRCSQSQTVSYGLLESFFPCPLPCVFSLVPVKCPLGSSATSGWDKPLQLPFVASLFSLLIEGNFPCGRTTIDSYTNTFHFPNEHNLKKIFFIILIHWYSCIMWLRLYLTFGPRQIPSMANFSPFSKSLPD